MVAPRRRVAEPEHLAPPGDVRAREPRRRPRRGRSRPRCARSRRGPGATFLDLGCGTGFHLPRFADDARAGDRRRAARRPGRARAAAYPPARRTSTVHQGTAQAMPLPDASVDVVQARWAYFFGPGCEPGLAELDRVVRRGGTAFVIDNDADPVDVRRVVPPRLPEGRPRRGRAVLVPARLAAYAGRHALVVRAPGGPGGGGADRVRRGRPRTRCWPGTRAPRSTTRSTSGARTSRRSPRTHEGRAEQPRRVYDAGPGQQPVERADHLDRDLLERLPDRGDPGRHHLGGLGVVEADDRDVLADLRPRWARVCSTPMARVSEAQTNAVGRASLSSRRGASRPEATVSSTRAARPVVARPRCAHRAASSRPGGPRRSGSPCASRSRRSARGPARSRGRWPAPPPAAPSTSTHGWVASGSSHGRPNATNGARFSSSQAACGLPR